MWAGGWVGRGWPGPQTPPPPLRGVTKQSPGVDPGGGWGRHLNCCVSYRWPSFRWMQHSVCHADCLAPHWRRLLGLGFSTFFSRNIAPGRQRFAPAPHAVGALEPAETTGSDFRGSPLDIMGPHAQHTPRALGRLAEGARHWRPRGPFVSEVSRVPTPRQHNGSSPAEPPHAMEGRIPRHVAVRMGTVRGDNHRTVGPRLDGKWPKKAITQSRRVEIRRNTDPREIAIFCRFGPCSAPKSF